MAAKKKSASRRVVSRASKKASGSAEPKQVKRAANTPKKNLSHETAQKLAIRYAARAVKATNRDLRSMGASNFLIREVSISDCPPPCERVSINVGGTTIVVCQDPSGGPCVGKQEKNS